ncbi:hypothetical protein [Limnohabitans sp. T6-20]|uniref:hypothetical protein n=1 Tax=Limnohabitans sp. T6-20 TaxID=1100725 RepID=UPI0011B1DE34|nr:hypothetical protein [Limnohabitans sp. T6-20]
MRYIGIFVSLMLLNITSRADHLPELSLWPTIPFIRGQDLCQYQDAYGQSRAQQAQEFSRELGALLQGGADPKQSVELLETVDKLIQQGRRQATSGFGMDMLLESSFKAALDRIYDEVHPKTRHISFFNPAPLNELVRELRNQKRQGYLDASLLKGLNAVAWGSYSYSPGCKGEVVAALHFETDKGQTFNFQARGLPESVMHTIASQAFQQFQKTHFPSMVTYRGQKLQLLGSPGAPIGEVSAPRKAEHACQSIQARLPTPGEYVFLSELGDWNGGINAAKGLWALSKERIWAPEMPHPSPVRTADEIHGADIRYVCVR